MIEFIEKTLRQLAVKRMMLQTSRQIAQQLVDCIDAQLADVQDDTDELQKLLDKAYDEKFQKQEQN